MFGEYLLRSGGLKQSTRSSNKFYRLDGFIVFEELFAFLRPATTGRHFMVCRRFGRFCDGSDSASGPDAYSNCDRYAYTYSDSGSESNA